MKLLKKYIKFETNFSVQKSLPYILIISAIVGLIASFTLTIEHINIYRDPSHHLSCSINPVLSCGPVMQSKEATVFGFPNPLIGLVMFGAQGMIGLAMLAGSKMKSWFWKLYGLGILGGLAFTLWLMWHSLYVIGAICIYCLMVWIVMFISAWYIFQFMLAEKHLKLRSKKVTKFIRVHHGDILLVWFLIITGLILNRFWYYYGPQLGF